MLSATTRPPDAIERWQTAWPAALAVWSRFTRLQSPQLCESSVGAADEGLTGSFAMIRLADQRVVIDLEQTAAYGLDDLALEILAHEIGHHVLAPASVTDHVRLIAKLRRSLPTLEAHAPMVANLYTDLLINDRLQRQAELRMAEVYRRLGVAKSIPSASPVWSLYMGIYEHLWGLPAGDLGGPEALSEQAGDAWLGARLVRAYAGDWLDGAGRFGALLLPYLVNALTDARLDALMDTRSAAQGGEPIGIEQIEADEAQGDLHPAFDPRVTGEDTAPRTTRHLPDRDRVSTPESDARGQAREPFEYGEVLRAGGLDLSDHEFAIRYYRERALPLIVPFPKARQPEAMEREIEGVEPWQVGDPLDEIDWLQSLTQSPRLIPGVTTMRRVYGLAPGNQPSFEHVDLDLYVDSSGSMPNPQVQTSYLALAGAIIALSALRSDSRVQVTLWSGKNQVLHTDGFVRSEHAILSVLTGFFGGATAFPIHRLRETYRERGAADRAAHILHLSDDGITTMFDPDERGNSGWAIAAQALGTARGGGTMALNLRDPLPTESTEEVSGPAWRADLIRAREAGWAIHAVRDMAGLIDFATWFSRLHYAPSAAGRATAQ